MARVPQGTRTERGVEQQGVGRGGTAQTTAGDIRIPGVQRDPGLSVNPRQFGSQVGQALQGLGQSVGDLAMVQRQVAERRQEAEDSIFLTRARSTLNQRLYETTLNTQNEVDNFGNFFETVTPKYQETRAAVLTELQGEFNPSEEALQRYEAIAEGLVGDYGIKAITFENNQKVAKYRDDLDLEVNRLAESVLTNGDLETGLAALNDTLAGFRGVMPPDEFRDVSRVAKAQLSRAYLEGIIRTNPGGAAAVMDHGLGRGGGEGSIIGAIIAQESNGNPDAVSPAGAVGLMQVMPDTAREIARELGDKAFPHDGSNQEVSAYLKDPETNTRYGKHYFQKMLRRYGGDVEAALVAYNGGPGRADNWLKAGRDDKVLPDETRKYYKKVLDRVDGASGDVLDLAFKNLQIGEQLRFVDQAERANNVRIKQFERAFGDHIANIENFGTGLEGFNVNEAQRFLDPEQFAEVERAVEQAHQNHEATRTIRYGPMGEAVAAVQDAAPVPGTEGVEDQIDRQRKFQKALEKRVKELKDDPARYAQQGFEDVAEAYGEAFEEMEPVALDRAINLSLEAQAGMDVPPQARRALPNDFAASLVRTVEQAPIDQRAQFLSAQLDRFGEHKDRALQDLRAQDLSDDVYIAALYADDPLLAARLGALAGVDEKTLTEGLENTAVKDARDGVETAFADYRAVFLAGDITGDSKAEFNALVATARKMALQDVGRGMDPGTAAENAYRLMVDKHMVLVDGGRVRAPVPREFDASLVESGAEFALTNNQVRDMDLRAFGNSGPGLGFLDEERTRRTVMQSGQWVYSGDGSGMTLMVPTIDGPMLIVRNADGMPVSLTFEEAESLGTRSDVEDMQEPVVTP